MILMLRSSFVCGHLACSSSDGQSFTHIELLVAISIVALLVEVIPALAGARARAKGTLCTANQRQIAQLTHLYLNDYHDDFPASYDAGTCPDGPPVAW